MCKIKDIDWEKCMEISNKTGMNDEYTEMTWGSPEEINYICECLWAFKRKYECEKLNSTESLTKIFGIPINRFRELFDLFIEKGFNIREDKDWKELKRTLFNIGGEKIRSSSEMVNKKYNIKELK